MKYSAIEIKNFRGIKHLTLNGLGDLNILTGRNNTGKSSCLEAIALVASGASNFKDIFKEDMIKFILTRRTGRDLAWDYLIRHGEDTSSITAFSNGKRRHSENILIGKTLSNLKLEPHDDLISSLREQFQNVITSEREINYRSRLVEKGPKVTHSMYFYYVNSQQCLARIFETNKGIEVISSSTRRFSPTMRRISEQRLNEDVLFIGNLEQIGGELHDIIAEKGLIQDVIERLHDKFPEITDLRPLREILYIFYGKEKMPLDTMGDGFKINLLITLSGHAISNGILILEEPENFLHPGLMIHLVQELTIACKKQNIQIFLTTHSDELIKFFLQNSQEIDTSIIKLIKSDNDIEAETFNKLEAKEKLEELGIDLRGF